MSDETPPADSPGDSLDLSSLNFGPAWARDDSKSKSVKKVSRSGRRW